MTYSLVARDPETGDLGVAVQSHFFSVGTVSGTLSSIALSVNAGTSCGVNLPMCLR